MTPPIWLDKPGQRRPLRPRVLARGAKPKRKKRPNEGDAMFLTLFIVLMLVWGFGWIVFRVSGVLIHLLLLVGLISLAVHFFRGRV